MISTGILINSPILFSPENNSLSSASISSIDTGTESHLHPPRIRFAPLPDPRRAADDLIFSDKDAPDAVTPYVSKLVTEHIGEYSPCLDTESFSSDYQTTPDPSGSSSIATDSPTRPSSPTTPTTTKPKPKPAKSWRTKSFFKPLLNRSSASVPTSPLSSSTESFSSSVFGRASIQSRRSESDNDTGGWGAPLRSWKSAGSPTRPSKPAPTSPVSRSHSTTPFTKPASGRSKSSSVSGLSLPLSTNHVRRGTRMLNGRVYGARHTNENPFANARDEADPAFVEWGHGGMGSVRNGVGGEMWKRLQTENQGIMVGSVEGDTWGKSADDGDDGSGMGWVKRRKEQREKQKKELEEKERKEREGGTTDSKDEDVQKPAEIQREDSTVTLTAIVNDLEKPNITSPPDPIAPPAHPSAPASPASPNPSAPVSPASPNNEAHILRAVTIPAPPHRHHSHTRAPSYSRASSNSNVTVVAASVDLQEMPSSASGKAQARPQAEGEGDDEDSSSDEEREEGDEDEDEGDEDATRKTALCAQVEKVSWHKEKGDGRGGES